MTASEFPRERRRYARLSIRSKITFRVLSPDGTSQDKEYRAEGKNISAAGILFTSEKTLEPGNRITMDILMPKEKDPIRISATVRWCVPSKGSDKDRETFDIGTEFDHLGKEHIQLLVKYVCGQLDE